MVILLLGLLTAIIIYPFLHETGHAIATILFGGKVIEFHLLPLPNILCDVNSMSSVGMVTIGISGMLFPFLMALIINKKSFVLWYISQVITGISAYAFFISIIGLIMNKFGFQISNEDVIRVVETIPSSETFLFTTTIILMIISVWLFIYNKPIRRIFDYLEIKKPRIA